MFYFSYFSDVVKDNVLVKDTTKRFDLLDKIVSDDKYFITVELVEGETIEALSSRIYGNPDYSWLVLLCNRGVHPFFANYKTDQEMTDYIKRKYSINMFDAHHYETSDGKVLDDLDTYYYITDRYTLKHKDIVQISYDEIERKENFEKRIIRLINPIYLTQIVSEIQNLSSTT
jgi:hypothetical protein